MEPEEKFLGLALICILLVDGMLAGAIIAEAKAGLGFGLILLGLATLATLSIVKVFTSE